MDAKSLIEILEFERTKLNECITKIYEKNPNAQITSGMTVKELLGHIAWYENRIVQVLKNNKANPIEYDILSIDDKNKQISVSLRNIQFVEVKKSADTTFHDLVTLLGNVSQQQLDDISILKNTLDERLPWQALIENSFIHYEEHMGSMRKWLKNNQ